MMRPPATIASTAITSGGKPSGTRPETPTTIRYIARTAIPMLRLNLNAIAPPEDETIQETPRRHNRTECDARADGPAEAPGTAGAPLDVLTWNSFVPRLGL